MLNPLCKIFLISKLISIQVTNQVISLNSVFQKLATARAAALTLSNALSLLFVFVFT